MLKKLISLKNNSTVYFIFYQGQYFDHLEQITENTTTNFKKEY